MSSKPTSSLPPTRLLWRRLVEKIAKQWTNFARKSKELFHWKHWVATVTALWVAGLTMGVGAYAPQIRVQAFYLAYALLVAAFVWSLGSFWTSAFLRGKKWEKVRAKKKRPATKKKTLRRFYIWAASISLLISAAFGAGLWLTWSTQVSRQLSEMGGVLIPANDPEPQLRCSRPLTNSLGIFYGTSASFFEGDRATIFAVNVRGRNGRTQQIPILQAERRPDGSIGINADIRSSDGKIIVQVSNNEFYINDNTILRAFNPRPDRSTLNLKDEFGNSFRIRLLNRHSIRVSGKFFIGPDSRVEIEEQGDTILPNGSRLGWSCATNVGNMFVFNYGAQ